jgi:CHAT domain-containing protein/tetratricopeptide (TPR) repeat protein
MADRGGNSDALARSVEAAYQAGRIHKARELLSDALLAERAQVQSGPLLATRLDAIAELAELCGDPSFALPLRRESVELCRTLGRRSPDLAAAVVRLGALSATLGDFAEPERLYREAIDIYESIRAPRATLVACLNNLASLLQAKRDLGDAARLYSKAVEMSRRQLVSDIMGVARELHSAARNLSEATLLEGAKALRWIARDSRRHGGGPHPRNVATLIRDIARRADLPEVAGALGLLERELVDLAIAQNNLGSLLRIQGDYDAAEKCYEEAVGALRELPAADPRHVATVLNNLAALMQSAGKFDKANATQGQALELYRERLGPHHPDVATALNNLAGIERARRNHEGAERLYRESLAIRRRALGPAHLDISFSLDNLASVLAATGRAAEALSCVVESQAIQDAVLSDALAGSSERQRILFVAMAREKLDLGLTLVLTHLGGVSAAIVCAFGWTLRRRALVAETVSAQRELAICGRRPGLAARFAEVGALRMRIANRALAAPDPTSLGQHQALLAVWRERREALERELSANAPELHLGERLREVGPEAVLRSIPDDAALVEFVRMRFRDFGADETAGESKWKPARYVAFVSRGGPDAELELLDLGDASELDTLVQRYGRAVSRRTPPTARKADSSELASASWDAGHALRDRILDPVLSALGSPRRLVVVPDGELCRLPLDVLPNRAEGYVIDDLEITYLPTARDLLRADTRSSQPSGPPVVVAAPDYDLQLPGPCRDEGGSLVAAFKPLGGARSEGARVAALLGTHPLLGSLAMEGPLKRVCSPIIMHLATHGWFLDPSPESPTPAHGGLLELLSHRAGREIENPLLRSGLALAGANSWLRGIELPPDAEDGILTAEDIAAMDLGGCELLVLSACDSGLGELDCAEGVLGLRWAASLAGAGAVVMSQWRADDAATATIMVEFYRRLLRGESRSEALLGARRAYRLVSPDPFSWGPFILQGRTGPMPRDVLARLQG